VILAAIVFSFFLTVIGLIGTIKVNMAMMFSHAFFCCSVLGAFFVYLLLDTFLAERPENERLTDTTVLALMSLPFLGIFLVGCHSMYLTDMIYDEIKSRR
jgi:hypothetical protein